MPSGLGMPSGNPMMVMKNPAAMGMMPPVPLCRLVGSAWAAVVHQWSIPQTFRLGWSKLSRLGWLVLYVLCWYLGLHT